ncbi:MAG: aspartate aminotransferase family protein [Sphingobacteriales bacterium]|nr:aspartate aminotransferase family protein [Sphingobacteriales bacterium]
MQQNRNAAIAMSSEEFKTTGYQLVDTIAALINDIYQKPVTTAETPKQLQQLLPPLKLANEGKPVAEIISNAADLLINHSLFNGHPKFAGYITSSPAPAGILADVLAAAVNPNAGAQILSPIATEIEKQTIQWLTQLINLPNGYGGIMVSGGNMANFTGFLAGRTIKAPKQFKEEGINMREAKLLVYCSKATHTWIEKAVVLFGLGTNAIRWIATNARNQMDNELLEQTIKEDISKGFKPVMIVGTAGDVSTGVVDDLKGIAAICKQYDLWFHIDGAYGAPAAVIPELKNMFEGMEEADSIALDPHKWLYSPLEAGCTLVKNPNHLSETFSSHPVYYNFDTYEEERSHNFYEYGLQNSRGFRALKVWVTLQQVGRNGYAEMIKEDIALSQLLFALADKHPGLEAVTQNLSIATLRYIPADTDRNNTDYINQLNETLLNNLQKGGEVFLSNAVINDNYCLRACIVNFRTSKKDIEEMIEIIAREGKKVHQILSAATADSSPY